MIIKIEKLRQNKAGSIQKKNKTKEKEKRNEKGE